MYDLKPKLMEEADITSLIVNQIESFIEILRKEKTRNFIYYFIN